VALRRILDIFSAKNATILSDVMDYLSNQLTGFSSTPGGGFFSAAWQFIFDVILKFNTTFIFSFLMKY